MNRSKRIALMAGFYIAACATSALAQQRAPRIGYAYPAGGQQGKTFEVALGGQALDGAGSVLVSGGGVQVKVVEHIKPISQQQAGKLRDELKELMDKRTESMRGGRAKESKPAAKWSDEDEKRVAEIRKKLATFVRRPMNPAIVETVILSVTVAANAEPGQRELRLVTAAGLTNPLVFQVNTLPEFAEKKAAAAPDGRFAERFLGNRRADPATDEPLSISLPAAVNGQIMPGDVDRFRFPARKGQRLVAAVSARQLMPYLADAVPGWFQATLALVDEKGKEVAYVDDYRFNPDPVLLCEIPRDGKYTLEIKDAIYRGREDFVYRIVVGELPFVTASFPLGGPAGAATTIELTGWNLPSNKLTFSDANAAPGTRWLSLLEKNVRSVNAVPFAVDTLPETLAAEPNDDPAHARKILMPVIVNGRIDRPGDVDFFRLEGRKGQPVVAEVMARRLNSPLDSLLRLTDSAGKTIAANDDCEDKGSGWLTHHADSYLAATLPDDGVYFLSIGDAEQKGGPEYAYRLRIGPPRPDFELRVVPASVTIRGGSSMPITVHAIRKDGCNEAISLRLKNAPSGFSLSGNTIPAGQSEVRLTISGGATPSGDPVPLQFEGLATIAGRSVVRPSVPAEDMMQAFAYRHLVPAQEFRAEIAGNARGPGAKLVADLPLKIPMGGSAKVRVAAPAGPLMNRVVFELSDPPEGITIKDVRATAAGVEIEFTSDAEKVKPGLKGNLIVGAFAKRNDGGNKPRMSTGTPLASLPAVPFEVVER